jgi:hypothetical protein
MAGAAKHDPAGIAGERNRTGGTRMSIIESTLISAFLVAIALTPVAVSALLTRRDTARAGEEEAQLEYQTGGAE